MSFCLYVHCVCLFLCHALKDRTAGGGGLLCVADAGAECFMFWFLQFFIIIFFFLQETVVIKLQIYIFLNFPSFFSVTLDYRNDKMIIMGIKVNLPLILSEIQCIPSLSWYFYII